MVNFFRFFIFLYTIHDHRVWLNLWWIFSCLALSGFLLNMMSISFCTLHISSVVWQGCWFCKIASWYDTKLLFFYNQNFEPVLVSTKLCRYHDQLWKRIILLQYWHPHWIITNWTIKLIFILLQVLLTSSSYLPSYIYWPIWVHFIAISNNRPLLH